MKKGEYIVGLLFIFAFLPIWHWMVGRWMAPGSYYSHGFLIPFMSGYLIWKKRGQIVLDTSKGAGSGLILVLGGLFVLLLSSFWQIYFTGAAAFLLVLTGTLVYLYGWKLLGTLWFPVLFLVFMLPIPLVLVADISLSLKLLAAKAAMKLIEMMGIIAIREGSYIHLKTGTMIVGDVCSGLRSLIALLAFGAFFSYISNLSNFKKILLFICSVPIAWIANIVRIMTLTLIANSFGVDAASGFVHDASGIFIFVIAFIMLFGVEKILKLSQKNRPLTHESQ